MSMYLGNSSPTRLGISTTARKLVESIDEKNFFLLGNKGTDAINRSSLYSYAMALGYKEGKQTPIKQQYTGGFIQDMSIDGQLLAIMCCQYLMELPPDAIDCITEKGQIYKMAEQYANTGFHIIAEAVKQSDEENYLLDQLSTLDELYDAFVLAE